MSYTCYCLSDAMLKRLSKVVNGQDCGGTSCAALVRRQLIVQNPQRFTTLASGQRAPFYVATDTGRWALEEARREGW